MPFSAHITDVIIKAGGAQNTLWLDWHKTLITFLVGFYPFGVFSSFNPEDPSAFWHNLESPDSEELSENKNGILEKQMDCCNSSCGGCSAIRWH